METGLYIVRQAADQLIIDQKQLGPPILSRIVWAIACVILPLFVLYSGLRRGNIGAFLIAAFVFVAFSAIVWFLFPQQSWTFDRRANRFTYVRGLGPIPFSSSFPLNEIERYEIKRSNSEGSEYYAPSIKLRSGRQFTLGAGSNEPGERDAEQIGVLVRPFLKGQ
ncbi:hypothetical protein [Gloeobacter kilaueensis]|uniref:Uncharacterized protein n=1 Tax=Gloeobacter kilaueensis (strain ATCC BAA-2537 / CCAP 1431/1 / ULC 316 / JS1) TaxID=1183438 RepID=U5QBZ6_GLOK1|nr:hypothetical protein [Gloeobacter kilaueensis]AGY56366.1 hypothetical protein GKIL_0119 [Gloeobacter kilaueensis JS1]